MHESSPSAAVPSGDETTQVAATAPLPIAGQAPAEPQTPVDPLAKIVPSARVLVTSREELEPVLQRHQRWIDAVLSPRVDVHEGRANLAGSDLSGLDLSGVNLSGATLTGCRLIGTVFRNANLRGANLSHSDAQGADFRGARLQRANFERADLREAEFEGADCTGAEFRYARRGNRDQGEEAPAGADASAVTASPDMAPPLQHVPSGEAEPAPAGVGIDGTLDNHVGLSVL